jgi:phosphoglucosamine mutase
MIAKAVFDALGAKTYVIGAEPNGLNVNKNCGSTHIEKLSELVKNEHLDFGFAFDGDCDRCIAVDENGAVVDGDKIMYILAKRLKNRGMLNSNTLVATVMSNSGLKRSLKKEGIHVVETKVGDRFVYEAMQKGDYSLGGEQSGHIILKKYATTGDGLLTAIMITEEICDQKIGLSKLCDSVMLYPQHTKNMKVKSKEDAANDSDVLEELKKIEAEIGGNGRILLRKSGTEPVVRIMAEAQTSEECKEYCARMETILKRKGHCDDKKS